MLNAISTAFSIGGALSGSGTPWFLVIVGSLILAVVWANEERIKRWLQLKTDDATAKKAIGSRWFGLLLQVVLGVVLMWLIVWFSNISILQPNVFVGYTSQPPFKFGRYIASIGRSNNPPGGFCPQAEITGDIINTSNQELWVWYQGDPITVWTQSPSVSFNGSADIVNISHGFGGHSSILPGSTLQVTISAQMDPSLCKDYKEGDLRNLRTARINASTSIQVENNMEQNKEQQSVSFLDLPIALGN
jgi:hypothetical protein